MLGCCFFVIVVNVGGKPKFVRVEARQLFGCRNPNRHLSVLALPRKIREVSFPVTSFNLIRGLDK